MCATDKFHELAVNGYGITGLACWASEDHHTYYSHISTFIGEYGQKLFKEFHQQSVNLWRDWSLLECDVDSKF